MKPALQIPATLDSIRTLKDGSVKISVETQELSAEQFAILAQYRNTFGFMLYKETQFSDSEVEDIPEVMPEFKGDKTPSQRLRAVFYRLWESQDKPGENFTTWYTGKMEQLIDHYKEKLP